MPALLEDPFQDSEAIAEETDCSVRTVRRWTRDTSPSLACRRRRAPPVCGAPRLGGVARRTPSAAERPAGAAGSWPATRSNCRPTSRPIRPTFELHEHRLDFELSDMNSVLGKSRGFGRLWIAYLGGPDCRRSASAGLLLAIRRAGAVEARSPATGAIELWTGKSERSASSR